MESLAYDLMPNRFHVVVWPREDDELSIFMHQLAMADAQRWRSHHGTAGIRYLYQGRFKSLPVKLDEHFLTLCRYVERSPVSREVGASRRVETWSRGATYEA